MDMQDRLDNERHIGMACVVVVDEDSENAAELHELLLAEGCGVLGAAADVNAVAGVLTRSCPDVAVLNLNLQGEQFTEIATLLMRTGLPFVIADEFDAATSSRQAPFPGIAYLPRPVAPARLIGTLAQVLGGKSTADK